MIHPSNLLRSDSSAVNSFSAPTNLNFGQNDFDCGITAIPWIATRCRLYKYAKVGVFIVLVSVLAFLQGCTNAYLIGTSLIWRKNYDFTRSVTEIVVFSWDIYGGFFAIVVAYWGSRIHRVTWLGGSTMIYAISGWILLVPELYHPKFYNLNTTTMAREDELCNVRNYSRLESYYISEGSKNISLSFFYIYQFLFAFSFISLITHGLTYIDDHIKPKNSALTISITFALFEGGRYVGIHLTLIPIILNRYIFYSFTWLILLTFICFVGFLIALFPKVLPSKISENGVAIILNKIESADNISASDFWQDTKRIFANKCIIWNSLSAGSMSIAIINFDLLSNDFFRTRFVDISVDDVFDYLDPLRSQFINVSSLPFICFVTILLGITVTKFKPDAKIIAAIIVVTYILTTTMFTSFAFLKCEDKISIDHGQFKTYCNADCDCKLEQFSPVCIRDTTYFSACYAGCKNKIDNIYTDCACGGIFTNATEGACIYEKCNYISIFSRTINIIIKGLMSGALVLHLLINMKTVTKITDKAYSLGLFIMVTKLLPYLPFKIFYMIFRDLMCSRRNFKGLCTIYDDRFSTVLSVLTIIIMMLSVMCAIFLMLSIQNIDFYIKKRKREAKQGRELSCLKEGEENSEGLEESQNVSGGVNNYGMSSLDVPGCSKDIELTNRSKKHARRARGAYVSKRLKSDCSDSSLSYSIEDITKELERIEQEERNKLNENIFETTV